MPRDIVSAIIDIAVAMYNTKNTSWIKSERVDGSEIVFSSDSTKKAESILTSYRTIYV
jgi:hypothetical protein